jgi:heme exporter protein D
MQAWIWVVIAVVVVAVIALVIAGVQQQRRRAQLRNTFGMEYDRTLERTGDRREAERELAGRYERRKSLDIRPLGDEQREAYAGEWTEVQARFVDAPADAVRDADSLLSRVMRERGYPVGEFEQRAADVSVDHPGVVDNYRRAHGISQRSASGQASTEDLRMAMVHYRSLFSELLTREESTTTA